MGRFHCKNDVVHAKDVIIRKFSNDNTSKGRLFYKSALGKCSREEMAMSMKIGDYTGISTGYQNNSASKTGKYNNVREYSNYLTQKFDCLKPGRNAHVR